MKSRQTAYKFEGQSRGQLHSEHRRFSVRLHSVLHFGHIIFFILKFTFFPATNLALKLTAPAPFVSEGNY